MVTLVDFTLPGQSLGSPTQGLARYLNSLARLINNRSKQNTRKPAGGAKRPLRAPCRDEGTLMALVSSLETVPRLLLRRPWAVRENECPGILEE